MVIFDTCVPIHDEQKILRPGMRPLGRAVRPTGRTALHTVLDAELWKALGGPLFEKHLATYCGDEVAKQVAAALVDPQWEGV